jgi:hypothetical protein
MAKGSWKKKATTVEKIDNKWYVVIDGIVRVYHYLGTHGYTIGVLEEKGAFKKDGIWYIPFDILIDKMFFMHKRINALTKSITLFKQLMQKYPFLKEYYDKRLEEKIGE